MALLPPGPPATPLRGARARAPARQRAAQGGYAVRTCSEVVVLLLGEALRELLLLALPLLVRVGLGLGLGLGLG